MKLFIIAAVLAAVPGIRINRGGFLPRDATQAVSGICACLIIISHSLYSFDALYALAAYPGQVYILDQLVVAPFLFFSGYGVALSARKKPDYIKSMPKKKLLPLYLRFALINTVSLAVGAALKTGFTAKQAALSYLCLDTVLLGRLGCCSWFVGVILLLWGASYLAYRLFPQSEKAALIMISILCVELYVLFRVLALPAPWWDTLLTFPAGLWCAYASDEIGAGLKKNSLLRSELIVVFALLTALCELGFRRGNPRAFYPAPLFLCAGIAVLSAQFKAGNRLLNYCGKRALYLYLVQEPVLRVMQYCEAKPGGFLRTALPALYRPDGRMNAYVYTALAFLLIFAAAEIFARVWTLFETGVGKWKKRKNSA